MALNIPPGRQFFHGGSYGRLIDIPDNDLRRALFQTEAVHDFAYSGAPSGNKYGLSFYYHNPGFSGTKIQEKILHRQIEIPGPLQVSRFFLIFVDV